MNILEDKIYACLAAGLIGDAMGAPVEGWDYEKIIKEHGWVNEFDGAGTDDSAIKLILCDALVSNEGYITADEFADSFLNFGAQFYNLFFVPVKNMFHKLQDKLCLPVYAGMGNMHSSSSAMCISPMGLVNACDPQRAAMETFDVAGLIHGDVATFCRDGACAMAAAVAEAMKADATVMSVVEAATKYLHKESSKELIDSINISVEKAKELKDYEAFRKWFYENRLYTIISDSRETIPAVLAIFMLSDGDATKAIENGANFGRDADTLGTMVGALAGAFCGTKGLKKEWIEKIEANNSQKELTQKLAKVIVEKKKKLAAPVELFNKII